METGRSSRSLLSRTESLFGYKQIPPRGVFKGDENELYKGVVLSSYPGPQVTDRGNPAR